MSDKYFNKNASALFSRFKDSHRAWAHAVIDELKRRYPHADHWTTGGESFDYIDIRVGKKTLGHRSGWPVFYIQQRPTRSGPVSLVVNKHALVSEAYQRISYEEAPDIADVIGWLNALELSAVGTGRLTGSGNRPTDFPDVDNASEEHVPETEESSTLPKSTIGPLQALNRILYGPPGTGKTYRTTHEALSIIERTLQPEGDAVAQRLRFDTLRRAGRIGFVTFHQSFSYEDFIEGIRAETEGGQLSYQVRDGIFKRMAITAMYRQLAASAPGGEPDFDRLHDAFIESVQTSLPYPLKSATGSQLEIVSVNDGGTFSITHPGRTLKHSVTRARLKLLYEAYPNQAALGRKGIVNAINDVTKGGNVTVYWAVLHRLLAFREEIKVELTETQAEVLQADDPADYAQIKRRVLAGEKFTPNGEPYVLIIDEINRGNMSRIFGELITLIETTKRAGGLEPAEVQLPYSNDRFSVPDNLYVIGTMNTADRSLAVVDTALRRRFDFIEMMPDLDKLANMTVEGVDIARMLGAINIRIELLYDREHMIGHSFFMSLRARATISELARIFTNNVLPLLEEYFYEDWEKIEKVLGNPGMYKTLKTDQLGFEHKGSIWRRDNDTLMAPKTYQRIYASAQTSLAAEPMAGND